MRPRLTEEEIAESSILRSQHENSCTQYEYGRKSICSAVNHELAAKIVLGVATIHLNQTSDKFREFFDAKLNEFYSDAPTKLEAARYALSIAVGAICR